MQPTGDRSEESNGDATWQPPLEADPADARDQARGVIDDDTDPEAPVTSPGAGRADDLDVLDRASEADLAEQATEVGYDDDADR